MPTTRTVPNPDAANPADPADPADPVDPDPPVPAGEKPDPEVAHRNEVRLVGRVSVDPEERTLPSGDPVVCARLVVARPPGPARDRQPVDVLDCTGFTARSRRAMTSWHAGLVVEVEGRIRRRFRRSPTGLTSRVEIEVVSCRRARPAA